MLNPITTLNNLAQLRSWRLQLETGPPQGPPHKPIIEAVASIEVSGPGLPEVVETRFLAGSSKAARAGAAQALLDRLQEMQQDYFSTAGCTHSVFNYKGTLQELLVQAAAAHLARYFMRGSFDHTFSSTSNGPVHMPTFIAVLEVKLPTATLTTTGSSTTKKDAEHQAAKAMLHMPEFCVAVGLSAEV